MRCINRWAATCQVLSKPIFFVIVVADVSVFSAFRHFIPIDAERDRHCQWESKHDCYQNEASYFFEPWIRDRLWASLSMTLAL